MITRQLGIPVTSPGAILRREKDLGTPLGLETAETTQRGGLVSDAIIVVVSQRLRLGIELDQPLLQNDGIIICTPD